MKKIYQSIMLVLMFLLFISSTKAQNWQPLGPDDNNQPSFSAAANVFVKTNHAGIAYMAFQDNTGFLLVKKYVNTQWVNVGGAVSIGTVNDNPSIVFDAADVPYIAYRDFGYSQGCVNVKKFNGSNWVQVGNSCFTGTFPDNIHLAITSQDSLYVLYRDGTTNKTNVKKDSANIWVTVGGADFSSTTVATCDMTIDANDNIYVAHVTTVVNKSSVQKLVGNTWTMVGNANFTPGSNYGIKIVTDAANNPIVGFGNSANNKPTALKWDGTNWNQLGTALNTGSTSNPTDFVLLMVNNNPTFIYSDFLNNNLSAQQFNGSNWSYIGNQFILPASNAVSYIGASSDASGNITVAYRDNYNKQKATAIQYNSGAWIDIETRGLVKGYCTDVRTFVAYNGTPYICYADVLNSYKACVKKFVGGSWVNVGSLNFSSDRADYISMAFDKNNVPYICYHDWLVNGITVQKFDGTNWVTVGVKHLTGRTAFTPSMAMDTATTTPYIVCQDDGAHSNKALVEKFNGSNWVVVGAASFSLGRIFNPTIAVSSTGNPYVIYGDEGNGNVATAKMFDGSNWVNVGTGLVSPFSSDYTTLTVGKNDTIFAAYQDVQVTNKAVVKRFDGTNWIQVGSNLGIGSTKYLSLATNGSGVPYIAYNDAGNGTKAYIKKYMNGWVDVAATSGAVTLGSTEWVSIATNKTNNTIYFAYSYGDVYAKTIGLSITSSAGAGGSITPIGSVDVAAGTNKSYTIAANAGYCIQDVLVDGVSIGAATNYTFNNVTISHSISASFISQVTPSVTISASPSNHICAGANVVFTATATNGGLSPNYNFKVNGNNVQNSSSNTFSSSSLNNDDAITCVLTANNFCQTKVTDNSNTIRMIVDVSVTPSISLMADNNNVCAGTNITFTATATNGGSSSMYNFMVNGNSVQSSNSNTFSSSSLSNNDVVSCVLTANNTCQTSSTAMSNNVNMTMIAYLTPSVTIGSNSGLNICSGSNVTFTATPVNGGTSPSYNFMVNGNSVQSSSSHTFSSSSLNNNDSISCIMSSNNPCQTANTANSNTLVMTLTANAIPTVSIQSNTGNTVCAGINVVFTATPVNGGNAPTFQWKRNGVNVGNNSNTYSSNNLTSNDSIWCVLTSNSVCVVTPTASSNKIRLTVNQLPAVPSAISGSTTICTIGGTNDLSSTTIGGVWSSSNTAVATINNAGKVTSVGNGTSTINYNVTNVNGCSQSVAAIYTVAAVSVAPITGLANVCVGATVQLSNATPNGVWISLNNRASVNANGLLTGLNGGQYPASIKYTVSNANGCSAFVTYAVTVNAIPVVPTITYAPGTPNPQAGAPTGSFCVGKVFTVVGTPNIPAGAWTAAGFASITSGGVVTINAVGVGSIKYTYTNVNGCSNSRTMVGNGFTCAARGVNTVDGQLSTVDGFTMYPNPAKGFINLNVETLIGKGSIVVTDLYGKTVKNQALSMGSNTVNISNLSKGFYLVSVITSEGKTTKKLVVE